jgi:transaldolase
LQLLFSVSRNVVQIAVMEEAFSSGNRPADGGDCEMVLASFAKAGINVDALAAQLQDEGAASFVKSWNDLIACIESKSAAMRKAS